jgi:hypothetical protein
MVRPLPFILLSAALTLATAGCESPVQTQPKETHTVTLDASARQAAATVALGNAIRLELPPPRQPGHVWQIVQNDTRFLQPMGALQPPGSGAERTTVTFRGMRPGRTQLKFLASAPTAATGGALEYYDVVVVVE